MDVKVEATNKKILYFVSILLVGIFVPQLLTDCVVKASSFFYSPHSYLWGGLFAVTAIIFSLIGCVIFCLSDIIGPKYYTRMPFLGLLVGQAALFIYMLYSI